jgi:succinyl-CoA synthetase alpha subunit
MSILIDSTTRLVVQGITGKAAQHHARLMQEYGTNIVGGVRPGAGGTEIHGIPVFDTVVEVCDACRPNMSILFVPAGAMKQAAFEALDAGIEQLLMVSEHVPIHDTMEIIAKARATGATVIGPNTPGLISPGEKCKVGFLPSAYYIPGRVGVASRSGTLTYELVARLSEVGIGQSTCVGVGGDPIVGTPFCEVVRLFQGDPETEAILLIGEIGGSMEEEVAGLVLRGAVTKPVVAYLAGRSAPPDKKMGHAGAIIADGRGSIESKLRAFELASIPVAEVPNDVVGLVRDALAGGVRIDAV